MSIMAGYDIDFAAIIWYELYKRAFGEIMTMSLPFLVQRLYNEVDV